jgi:succinoglycan biosynthesis transport protein ExoP
MQPLREAVPAASLFGNTQPHESYSPSTEYPNDSHLPISWYRHIIWNRRWTVLAIALPVFLVSFFGTVRQKPTYRATGTLEIDMPRNSVTSLNELFQEQAAPDSYLQTQAQMLRSSVLVTRVIGQLNPGNTAKPTQDQVNDFQSRLSVDFTKGSPLLQVNYDSHSPELAAGIVNRLMALSIDETREQRSLAAVNASGWLLDQLNQTKAKLEQASVALARYEEDHRLFFVETTDGGSQNIYNDRLLQLQTELTRVQTVRIEKESIYKQAQAGDASTLHNSVLDDLLKKESDTELQHSQLAAKFGPNFPQVRQVNENLAQIRSQVSEERTRALQEAATEYKVALRQENLLRDAFEAQKRTAVGTSQQSLQHSILKGEVDLDRQVYDGLLKQMNEAGISSTFAVANARIVEAAQPPSTPIRPRVFFNLALGVLLGLSLGVLFTFLQEHLLDRFRSEDDVQTYLNLPLLASIPAAPLHVGVHANGNNGNGHNGAHLNGNAVHSQSGSDAWFRLDRDGSEHFELSEAFRNLRTSLMFPPDGAPSRSVLISSAVPAEGKTTVSANVSVALAQLGKSVLLIDGDLRRPSLHKVFSIKNDTGLTDYLQEQRDWRKAVRPSGIQGLDVMVSGERPSNPAELLSSSRMRELIRQAKTQYDMVVLDSPTLLHMADGRVLASYVEAVLLIVKSEATPRKLVKQACANLRSVTGRIMGVVLNQVDLHGEESSYSNSN